MATRSRDTVTVSPPTIDRTAFAAVDAAIPAAHAPFARDWLMARFAEGLQIRLLTPPYEGLVLFQPGRLSWRPLLGAERALVVHDLRVSKGRLAKDGAMRLWAVAESFASYYGFTSVLALIGDGEGLVAAEHAPGRGWMTLDEGPDGSRLVGRILQGPVALPSLPDDWGLRAAGCGAGIVIQTTGESAALEALAERTCDALAPRGVPIRHDRLVDARAVQACAMRPGAAYTVACDGVVIGGAELDAPALLRHALGSVPSARHRPS